MVTKTLFAKIASYCINSTLSSYQTNFMISEYKFIFTNIDSTINSLKKNRLRDIFENNTKDQQNHTCNNEPCKISVFAKIVYEK